MSKTEITPTPTSGPWESNNGGVWNTDGQTVCVMYSGADDWYLENSKANGALIAEAGTVYHETKLTPRQLLEQRDELLKALKVALTHLRFSNNSMAERTMTEAISKVEGE